MGLLQRAIETYEANEKFVGIYQAESDPLAPIGHTLTSANIEITLDHDGEFITARKVDKKEPKILIPVTEESAGRASGPAAHPLCDNLKYISPNRKKEHSLYLEGLESWAKSSHSHPILPAVLAYVKKGSILSDLKQAGILDSTEKYDEKQFICWRVIDAENEEPACWKNLRLFQAFIDYYAEKISDRGEELCMIEGSTSVPAIQHPKGIIPINGNAKLISANDMTGFTYRGRFSEKWQAVGISYIASQKAHNAIRWLAASQGVREFSGNRIFLCWEPKGIRLPSVMRSIRAGKAPEYKPSNYREQLQSALLSFRKETQLKNSDTAVIAAFDAATTGRLALTYYNEITIQLFLSRIHDWDAHCCWFSAFGIQAPSLLQIVEYAFGTQRGNFMEADDRIQRQHLQRLLDCKLNGGVIPVDIVKNLVQRASTPQAYETNIWRKMMHTACAALQKYRFDTNQGGNEMDWELNKLDRSFQFGRLLAVMDRAEADYYYKTKEIRQTNAIKSMSEFRRRPLDVFERINRQLQHAYLNRISPKQAARYTRLIGEIFEILRQFSEEEINRPLDSIYLMGYELQRNAFFNKEKTEDDNTETEE